ncbi:MAG: sorbosone dehydrogenase family protein [Pyrinomonadaceae bacterium]
MNEQPLPVKVERAFPNLQWPDDITGADEGMTREVRPIVITGAGDGSNRLFLATQWGTIYVIPNDQQVSRPTSFLDIRDRVAPFTKNNEEGFLGLAFHPKYEQNGEFFVYYTAMPTKEHPNQSVISRFRVSKDDPNKADPNSEEVILTLDQPYWNHNGGTIVFGPDGFLYIGLGDGGAANDPHMNGQNLQTLLGKILRIDIDRKAGDKQYAIPQDNPFVANPKLARPEIWAYGIRNIWRMSFDRQTGECWAADVGQDLWEEVDLIVKGGNYGWNLREGKHSFGPGGVEPQERLIEPVVEYHHDTGKSITGGYVYRGQRAPSLTGGYLYGDYVSGLMWAVWYDAAKQQTTANRPIESNGLPIVTYGEDDNGEVYWSTNNGQMFWFSE